MESKAKILGHPIHPILITIPLGLFVAAVVFDLIALLTGEGTFARVAFWNIAGGIVGGLVAAIPGAIDWANIPSNTRAKRIGAFHGLGNVAVVALFAVAWWLRRDDPGVVATAPFVIALVAIGLGTVTGWLGGELVERLGVGVDEGAHLNAPSSLSGLPASAQAGESLREREVGS
jgi:Predicted membrane protein